MRKITTMLIAGLVLASSAIPTLAGQWQRDDLGWRYQEDDGSYPAGKWQQINGKWYYFRDNGYMAENQWVEGMYYVNENGEMLTNTTTPDGYQVGADGKWDGKGYASSETEGQNGNLDYSIYRSFMEEFKKSTGEDGRPFNILSYFLYDIDGDGIKELDISTGHSHASMKQRVYTIRNGQVVYLDSPTGGYASFSGRPAGGMYVVSMANGGHYSVGVLTLQNGKFDYSRIIDTDDDNAIDAYMPDAIDIPEYKDGDWSPLR